MRIETQCFTRRVPPRERRAKRAPDLSKAPLTDMTRRNILGKLFDLTAAGHMYSRISNPTVAAVEEKIAAMEGGVGALCTTSGRGSHYDQLE